MQVKAAHINTFSISFIIPYYNLPVDMMRECIDSILALPLQPQEREIIIVDDGSDNNVEQELQAYEDVIRYIRKENEGVSVARNIGLQEAKGEYIQFVDADDRLMKAPYIHCMELIRNTPADMLMFDFTTSPSLSAVYTDEGPMSGSAVMSSRNIHGSTCCYLFRKTISQDCRFTPGVCYGEDEEFTSKLLLQTESVLVTDAQAYFYRKHEGSATQQTNRNDKRLSDTRAVISRLHHTAHALTGEKHDALQRRVAQLTMDYIYNVIRLTKSEDSLNSTLDDLRSEQLFPLPDKAYTTKYAWFRRMTNSSFGRKMLLLMIPLMKKER